MSALARVHAAIDRLAELTGKDLRLVTRRTYFEHQVCGSYVAQVDGYQPLLSAAATSPEAAVGELADKVTLQLGAVERMMGGRHG